MSLLDQLGTAAGAVGQGIESAAKWGWNQTAAGQAVQQKKALQQQQQEKLINEQATRLQQQFENQLRLQQAGAVPKDVYANGAPLPGRPTLMTPEANPAAQGAGQTVTDPNGNEFYIPTQSEKDLAAGKTYIPTGQMADALKSGGWDGKTPVTPEFSHSVMQALNEAQPNDEGWRLDTSGKFLGPDGKPVPVMIGDKSGKVRMLDLSGGAAPSRQPQSNGASADGPFNTQPQVGSVSSMSNRPSPPGYEIAGPRQPAASPSSAFSFAPQDKPDVSQIVPGMQGPNGGLVMFNKTDQSTKEVPLPTGSQPVMTAAQTEADKDRHVRQSELDEARSARQATASQAAADRAAKGVDAIKAKHADFQSKEQDQWYLKGEYDRLTDPTQTPDTTSVTLPSYNPKTGEVRDGQTVTMNNDLRASLAGLSGQAQRKALEYQKNAAGIRKSMGWGEFSKPAAKPAAAPTPKPTAAAPPAAPASAKKPASQLRGGQKVGDTVQLKGGKAVKIKQIYSDGTFDY